MKVLSHPWNCHPTSTLSWGGYYSANCVVKTSDEDSPGSRGGEIDSTIWWEKWQISCGSLTHATVDGDCSHEIKRRLLLERKAMTNLDSILKNRDITLPTKVSLVKVMVFPVVHILTYVGLEIHVCGALLLALDYSHGCDMYGCESWTMKKAERWRTDAFELCCWRRLLRVPWTARRSNQSILKEISPEYSLEGWMLKLKLQYFGHLMQRSDSFEKTLMLGKIEGGRRRARQRMRWLDGITRSVDMSFE